MGVNTKQHLKEESNTIGKGVIHHLCSHPASAETSSSADLSNTLIERNVHVDGIKVVGLADKTRIKCLEVL
jgi:hypothetical protein